MIRYLNHIWYRGNLRVKIQHRYRHHHKGCHGNEDGDTNDDNDGGDDYDEDKNYENVLNVSTLFMVHEQFQVISFSSNDELNFINNIICYVIWNSRWYSLQYGTSFSSQ